ncbi:MAG: 6-phosphogluconolactonase [Pseudomonadota bacterium]
METFANNQQLTDRLTEALAGILSDAIKQRGHAYLVVSGGNTPRPLFNKLSHQDIDWQKVTITLADERWVLPDSDDSNDKLVKTVLLKNKAAKAQFISLFGDFQQAGRAATEVADKLAQLPPFDAVILGMGEDGHTASLFPDCEQLAEGLESTKAALAVEPQSAPYQRLSLSRSRLLNSHHLFFHITGNKKRPVLEAAQAKHQPQILPISDFFHQTQVPTRIFYAPA